MAVSPTFPGVYIQEVSSGVRTITNVATSITAFVGYTPKGPINRGTRVLGFADYERIFGGLSLQGDMGHAVQQFFLNGGSEATIVRLTKGALTAKLELRSAAGVVLDVEAISPGTWGNLVRIDVDYKTRKPDALFNMTLVRFEQRGIDLVPVESETHVNLSMAKSSARFVESIVNSSSKLVKVKRAGLTFANAGESASAALATPIALGANETTIAGILDRTRPFTLVLSGAPYASVAALVAAVKNAITAAGLASDLDADEVGPGFSAGTGHLRLFSKNAGTDESAVEITTAVAHDAARALRLGTHNGGRERDAASEHRPLQTGSVSADLQGALESGATVPGGPVTLTVFDASNPTLSPLPTVLSLSATYAGGPIANLVQDIRALLRADPKAAGITVDLVGTQIRAQASPAAVAGKPPPANLVAQLASGTTDLLTPNVREYWLGVGPTFGGQQGAAPGNDGSPPDAQDFVTSYGAKTGIYALRDVDLFNLLCIPDTATMTDSDARDVIAKAESFCRERRAMLIIDPLATKTTVDEIEQWSAQLDSDRNAALFFPRVLAADPIRDMRVRDMPASGAIAGVFARTDVERGVWKAPAGTEAVLRGVQALTLPMTDAENGVLNPVAVNCLRNFPLIGNVIWGSRTKEGADALASEWKYIPVRRTALLIEESLYRGTKWVVFEPNDEPLWSQIRLNVGSFMHSLYRRGAFQGRTPREAYLVKCDAETTTEDDRRRGIVNILVGFAPLKPAEFVVITIQQLAGQIAA